MARIVNPKIHGASSHMPDGPDGLTWLGDSPFPASGGTQGIHMLGVAANMPPASQGEQSGIDGVVAHSGTTLDSATANFGVGLVGLTLQIWDPDGASFPTPPTLTTYTISSITSTTELVFTPAYTGTGGTGLRWATSGAPVSNRGALYYASDAGAGLAGGTGVVYESDGAQWVPLTGNATGLPPWFDFSADVESFVDQGTFASTPPAFTVDFAYIMVQTTNGVSFASGGTVDPVGTCLGSLKVTLTSGGSVPGSTNTSTGVWGFYPTSAFGIYRPLSTPYRPYVIGSGYARQAATNTFYAIEFLNDGTMLIPNTPDLTPPSSVFSNLARLANAHLGTNAWPWVWASGDEISVNWSYPMGFGA